MHGLNSAPGADRSAHLCKVIGVLVTFLAIYLQEPRKEQLSAK